MDGKEGDDKGGGSDARYVIEVMVEIVEEIEKGDMDSVPCCG